MLREYLTGIANSIRATLGTNEVINAQDFPDKVQEVYDAGYVAGQQAGGGGDYDSGYEAGREMGQSDVWDMVQDFGRRTFYFRGFNYWSGKNFKPKYPVQATSLEYAFAYFAYNDEETVDLRGIDLDTSKCTSFNYMCNFGRMSAFGVIDTTGATTINNIFYNATELHTVEKLILKDDGSQTYNANNVFRSCEKLVNIIVEGKFGSNLSLTYCRNLSKDSICQIVNALFDTASGQTLTLSPTAVNKAFETSEGAKDGSTSAEWSALVATKPNWTISV